jgi:ABC-2 type transport system permease protein
MIRIFDIAANDLRQMLRDRKTFLFFLIMPIIFTFMFGFAFGGGGSSDPRLPVGFRDEDKSEVSQELRDILAGSKVVRLAAEGSAQADLESQVADQKLAGAIIVPAGYGRQVLYGKPVKLTLLADTAAPAGQTVESEALSAYVRLENAVRTAVILEEQAGDQTPFDYTFSQVLTAWKTPPIQVIDTTSLAIQKNDDRTETLARTSPGMMLQFAIAGLLVCASVIVNERKSHSLWRLLTTSAARVQILLGHYLAIVIIVFGQFLVLIAFGQIVFKLDYTRAVGATLLLAFTAALCIGALGLLIGTLAKSEEQAVIFSLIPMFLLAGIGGAWVPLEITGPTFQAIGHLSPVAWAMDGFKNITLRGLGLESVLLPAAALLVYAALFFAIAAIKFQRLEEK